MTNARATIDVVGAEARAKPFLEEIIFLVGASRGRKPGHATAQPQHRACGELDRFFPRGRLKPAVAPDERCRETLWMTGEAVRVAALETEMSAIHLRAGGPRDVRDLVAVNANFELTSDAAVSAGRADGARRPRQALTVTIGQRLRGADFDARAAAYAFAVAEFL